MANLRLVGVQEDGEHLILTSEDGANFSLRIDEALRVAASSALVRPESGQPPETFTPRDIQARIRAGATAEQISTASKLPIEHIHKYEGPVLAERAHIATLAQKALGTQVITDEHALSPLDPQLPAIDKVIDYQLKNNGIDTSDIDWDAWRQNDGSWLIILSFRLTNETMKQQARWSFALASQKLEPLNAWAKRLVHSPIEMQSISTLKDLKNNEEKKKEENADLPPAFSPPAQAALGKSEATDEPATYGLLDKLRSRRGQRLGTAEEEDDEIALFLTRKEAEAKDDLPNDDADRPAPAKPPKAPAASPTDRPPVATAKVLPFRAHSQYYGKKPDDFYTVRIKDSYDKTFEPPATSSGGDFAAEEDLTEASRADNAPPPSPDQLPQPQAGPSNLPAMPETTSSMQVPAPVKTEDRISLDADPSVGLSSDLVRESSSQDTEIAAALSRRNKKNRKMPEDAPPLPNPISASTRQVPVVGQKDDSFPTSEISRPQDGFPESSFGGDAIAERARKKTGRSKRSSVPSWDDIVFGTKGDN